MYTYRTRVRLPDTDAAGILFFGNYFRLAHDAYETFMTSLGYKFARVLNEEKYLALIAHAEADFIQPLKLSEEIAIELIVEKIQQSSFVLAYTIRNEQDETAATVRTVHVTVEKDSGQKVPLPDRLREQLEQATAG